MHYSLLSSSRTPLEPTPVALATDRVPEQLVLLLFYFVLSVFFFFFSLGEWSLGAEVESFFTHRVVVGCSFVEIWFFRLVKVGRFIVGVVERE
jgi:hypothetical protein